MGAQKGGAGTGAKKGSLGTGTPTADTITSPLGRRRVMGRRDGGRDEEGDWRQKRGTGSGGPPTADTMTSPLGRLRVMEGRAGCMVVGMGKANGGNTGRSGRGDHHRGCTARGTAYYGCLLGSGAAPPV